MIPRLENSARERKDVGFYFKRFKYKIRIGWSQTNGCVYVLVLSCNFKYNK